MRYAFFIFLTVFFCALSAQADEAPSYKARRYDKVFATGLKRPKGFRVAVVDNSFQEADAKVPGTIDLRTMAVLKPVWDQGQCGSCVYNAVLMAVMDQYILQGKTIPELARQYLMSCGAPWQCDGSYAQKVLEGLIALGGVAKESAYPYRAQTLSCKGKVSDVYGLVSDPRQIASTPKSVMTAMLAKHVPVTTVAADTRWMNYSSGIYNGCSSMETNHEIAIVAASCESSVDSDGNCVFNAKGYPVNGDGYVVIQNSWGMWGDKGYMKSRWLGSGGQLCNNIAEEVFIFDLPGGPPPPPPPVVNGGWSEWGPWSDCVNGVKKHERTCTNPPPSGGGKSCVGDSVESAVCDNSCHGWFMCFLGCWVPFCHH